MSDEEIRDLLDLGAADYEFGPPIEADQTWTAGRRWHTRRSWGVGLGAVAAAAAVVGVVWAQGLGGGDVAPPPPQPADGTLTDPVPTLTDTGGEARGEPFFAQFEKAGNEAPFQLSGASEPATLEDLQGTWIGPDGEEFVFDGERLRVTATECHGGDGSVELSPEGRLTLPGDWANEVVDLHCPEAESMTPWWSALSQQPLLSMDGESLLISGFDGTSENGEEARTQASLTLGAIDEAGFIWEDRESQTGVTPLALGEDFQLMVSADGDESGLTSISDLNLESPQLCGQVMTSSLRSDGVLLAGTVAPWPVCSEGEDALPPAEPPPAVVALLRSGPTVTFEDDTMVITGTVPESLLDQDLELVPDDSTATSEAPEQGAEDPPASTDLPSASGTPRVVVMSEGEWEPTGELTPLTDGLAVDRRWLPVTTDNEPPEVGLDPNGDRGLSYDGTTWRIRDCGIDISVDGAIENGRLLARGEPDVVPDPDPGAACVFPLTAEDWVSVLTGEPVLSTDGEILVIAGGVGNVPLEPVAMALRSDGTSDSGDEHWLRPSPEELAAGLVEVPEEEARSEGLSDVRDPQPAHTTTLSMLDGTVSVDVGCAEPLRGSAWYSHVGPEDVHWQLTAAVPDTPACTGAAVEDAELWRQMLAHGVFLFPFEGHWIVDSWAEPATP